MRAVLYLSITAVGLISAFTVATTVSSAVADSLNQSAELISNTSVR